MYGVEKAVGSKPAFDKKLLLAGDCQKQKHAGISEHVKVSVYSNV